MMPVLLARYWQLGVGAIGCLVLGLMLLSAKSDARHWHKRFSKEQAAHQQTVTNYRLAQAEAVKLDAANKTRAEKEQRAITERITDDYENRISDVRARYAGLVQAGAPAAHPGSGGSASMPGASATAVRADGAASENRIPPEDALIATEQAIQLEALQQWVKDQARVEN